MGRVVEDDTALVHQIPPRRFTGFGNCGLHSPVLPPSALPPPIRLRYVGGEVGCVVEDDTALVQPLLPSTAIHGSVNIDAIRPGFGTNDAVPPRLAICRFANIDTAQPR